MENSLLAILEKFGQMPCTVVQDLLSNFGTTLIIHKNSNFDQNQFKISTQHKYMYIRKCNKNGEFSLNYFDKHIVLCTRQYKYLH